MKYTLDAQNKKLGRVASEAAKILMGKNTPEYVRNAAPQVHVEIINASKIDLDSRKLKEELKSSYSGYPSGIKTPTVGHVVAKSGHKELFRRAIQGMLPHNKLRKAMMKNLIIKE